ncbi:hypothetical protein BJ742DRAFT_813692 [Cladochytrium replicatum]|nr:hypothetical protein BJ742DRAFT_813692 [Cladochytrium replicatum]
MVSSALVLRRTVDFVGPALFLVLSPVFGFAAATFSWLRYLRTYVFSKRWNPRGKVILITGASGGLGKFVALRYAAQGARLALCARRVSELENVAAECRAKGAASVNIYATDVASDDSVRTLVESLTKDFGVLDCAVLNAGISMAEFLREFPADQGMEVAKKMMDVNYLGCVGCTVRALPLLKKGDGRIGVISSQVGLLGLPTRTYYCGSKWALKGFFDALRTEEPWLKISLMYPGVVATDLDKNRFGSLRNNKATAMDVETAALIVDEAIAHGVRDDYWDLTGRIMPVVRDFLPEMRDYIAAKNMHIYGVKKTQ